jgi:ATP/maltotriose-dependent transcriptional regulator MalT
VTLVLLDQARSTALLERDPVLAELLCAVPVAPGGPGRLVLLSGEAGVGKTSVIRQLGAIASAAHSARVLVGCCEPLATPRPLGPLTDLVDRLGSAVEEALARALDGSSIHQLFDRVLAELDRADTPTVLVFEDVHWADEATLDLVRFLARRIESVPAMLVLTYRGDELGRTHPLTLLLGDLATSPATRRIEVRPLSRAAVAELAELTTGRDVDVDELYRVTSGNPFFVTEALTNPGEVPPTVRAAVHGRLARLSSTAHAAVEALAVIGPTVSAAPLAWRVVPGGRHGVAEALENGLLRSAGGVLEFRHELARMAVLDAIPAFRRIELHQAVLSELLAGDAVAADLAQIVQHAEQAGDHETLRRYAPRAGQHAASVGAHREAAAHFRRALRFVSDLLPAEHGALLQSARREHYLAGQIEDAIGCAEEALALYRRVDDHLAEGDSLRVLSHLLWSIGRIEASRPLAAEALNVLRQLAPSAELARAYANLVELSFVTGDSASVLRYEQTALELAQRLDLPDVVALVSFYATAARLQSNDEGWAELIAIRDHVVANGWLEQVPILTVLTPGLAAYRHDPHRALPMLDEAQVLVGEHDMRGFLVAVSGCRAYALMHAGDWCAAAAEAEAMRRDPQWAGNLGLPVFALLRARRGELDVWAELDAALAWYEEPYPARVGPVHEARAEAAWLAGDNERAIAEASRGWHATSDPWQLGALACWIHRAGGLPPAGPVAAPYALELAGHWTEAADAYERRGLPYEAAMARLQGDVDAVRQALATFTALGAEPAADRARARLRGLGERRGTRRQRSTTRSNEHTLTDRQQDVLALLRDGMSNAKIAQRLVLSQHTVSHHVSAVLGKLGATSRLELVTSRR